MLPSGFPFDGREAIPTLKGFFCHTTLENLPVGVSSGVSAHDAAPHFGIQILIFQAVAAAAAACF